MYKLIGLVVVFFILFVSSANGQIIGIKIAGDTCTDLTLIFQAEGASFSPYFFWNFGDPSSGTSDTTTITGLSTSPNPSHTFTSPGIYTICVTFQEPGFSPTTVCRTLFVGLCCNGIIASSDTCLQNNIPFSIVSSASITSVLWNFGDPSSGVSNTSTTFTPSHLFTAVGSYTVTAVATAPCGVFTIAYPIRIVDCNPGLPCSGVITVSDTCLSSGANFAIRSPSVISSINWNFGDPSTGANNTSTLPRPLHSFSRAGTFTITATGIADCGSFSYTLRVTITNCNTTPCAATIYISDSCANSSTQFRLNANSQINSVTWYFGDSGNPTLNTATGLTAQHTYNNAGSYISSAVVNLNCGTVTLTKNVSIVNCATTKADCSCVLPTGFTPNSDGQNDIFYPRGEDIQQIISFNIYNRWGELMFSRSNINANEPSVGWDGKYNGKLCAPDIYMYYVERKCASGKQILIKGDVMIIN